MEKKKAFKTSLITDMFNDIYSNIDIFRCCSAGARRASEAVKEVCHLFISLHGSSCLCDVNISAEEISVHVFRLLS